MSATGTAGWVALGVSLALGVVSTAAMVGCLLGREEWVPAGAVAGIGGWIVLVVSESARARRTNR